MKMDARRSWMKDVSLVESQPGHVFWCGKLSRTRLPNTRNLVLSLPTERTPSTPLTMPFAFFLLPPSTEHVSFIATHQLSLAFNPRDCSATSVSQWARDIRSSKDQSPWTHQVRVSLPVALMILTLLTPRLLDAISNDEPQPTIESIEPSNDAPQSKALRLRVTDTSSKAWKQQTICAFWGRPKKTIKSKKNWRQQTLCYLWGKNFPLFARFPAEIQRMVWEAAVPDPKTFRGGILYYINFDLSKPRALIPRIKDIQNGYSRGCFDISNPRLEFGELDLDESRFEAYQRPLISLVHACKESRMVALKLYTLDIESDLPGETGPIFETWIDFLYLPTPAGLPDKWKPVFLAYIMSSPTGRPHWNFPDVQRLALDLDEWLLRILRIFPEQDGYMDWAWSWNWLKRFSQLMELRLVGRFKPIEEDDMKSPLTFSRVLDGVMYEVGRLPLDEIYGEILERCIAGFEAENGGNREDAPSIEFWEVTRKSNISEPNASGG
jgi:hypothetical protein